MKEVEHERQGHIAIRLHEMWALSLAPRKGSDMEEQWGLQERSTFKRPFEITDKTGFNIIIKGFERKLCAF